MSATIITFPVRQPSKRYFEGCPVCGQDDGFLNIRAEHYMYCETHRRRWSIGWNLFSGWRDENVTMWRANLEKLRGYVGTEITHDLEGGPGGDDDELSF